MLISGDFKSLLQGVNTSGKGKIESLECPECPDSTVRMNRFPSDKKNLGGWVGTLSKNAHFPSNVRLRSKAIQ